MRAGIIFPIAYVSSVIYAASGPNKLPSDVLKSTISEPQFHQLPPLREQARLQDSWTAERRSKIPDLLAKYGVDAWLVSFSLPTT
jgi:hypothetical protein